MIARDLDFPEVTLVSVLNADTSLNLPDFRSNEYTLQLLIQAPGRAGRTERPGEVMIQAFNPQHYAIKLAKKQNYEQFYQQEMYVRHRGGYLLYYFTMKITASHPEERVAIKKIFQTANQLKEVLSLQSLLLGPAPSMTLRVKNRYHYQPIIKYRHKPNLPHVLDETSNGSQKEQRQGFFVTIDNEPLNSI